MLRPPEMSVLVTDCPGDPSRRKGWRQGRAETGNQAGAEAMNSHVLKGVRNGLVDFE